MTNFKRALNEYRSNPIAGFLAKNMDEKLSYAYRTVNNDDDALVISNFDYTEKDGYVESLALSFNVRSWGHDILKDEACLKAFEKVVQETFNCTKIVLTHAPNNEFGMASYTARTNREMADLLEALQSVGCKTKHVFDVPFHEKDEIARIGFFGENKELEAYIVTDDAHPYPHFHIRDRETLGELLNVGVALEWSAYYMPHENATQQLTKEQSQMLNDFINEPCRSPHYTNNYEFAVDMWNMNNSTQFKIHRYRDSGRIIVPDYAHMSLRKVAVIQDMRDDYDCDSITQTESSINPLFYKLTKKFLGGNSELKRILLEKFHYLPWCRLVLVVEFEQESSNRSHKGFIKSIELMLSDVQYYENCGFGTYMDDKRHEAFGRMTEADEVLAEYFKSIGLPTIHPTNVEEMETFLNWMAKEVPIIENYINVSNYGSEDYETEQRRKTEQWRAMEKAIAELQGFDTSDFDEYYREQDNQKQKKTRR